MKKIIETERLILRTWQDPDAEPFFQMNQDLNVIEYLPRSLTLDEVKSFIASQNQQYEEKGYTLWAVEEKASRQMIGFIGLNYTDWKAHFTPAVEVGWRLAFPFWGKGYATEGAKAAIAFGFNQCGLNEIVSFTSPKNIRSRRVMEKIGMHHKVEDNFRHPRLPEEHPLSECVLYRITK